MSETSDAIAECERVAFHQLREAVSKSTLILAFHSRPIQVTVESGNLRKNARIIDEIDVTLGFAELAVEMNFVRPAVTERYCLHLWGLSVVLTAN